MKAETEKVAPKEVVTIDGSVFVPDRAKMSLAAKIAAIMGDLQNIPKNGRNKHFDYSFMREADVTEAVRILLAKYSVAIMPHTLRVDIKTKEVIKVWDGKEKRSEEHTTLIEIEYTLINGDDKTDTLKGTFFGVALDGQDKGINKASTAAHKYFLLRTFNIGAEDDTENDAAGGETALPAPRADSRPPARSGTTPAASVVASPGAVAYDVPYKRKDEINPILKEAKFRWNPDTKFWHGDISRLHVDWQAELEQYRQPIAGAVKAPAATKPLVTAPPAVEPPQGTIDLSEPDPAGSIEDPDEIPF